MLRTLIIDDEPLARDEMRRLLAARPEVMIVGEAAGVRAAKPLLEAGGYDLVLLDIQLGGGSGFELVPHVLAPARIIFVTAHDRHALRAFEVNALDYLLKPVMPPRLAAALGRLAELSSADAANTPAEAPPLREPADGALHADDRVFLQGEHHARFVAFGEISAIVSCENYSAVQTAAAERFLVRRTLKSWEDTLPAGLFARVHRTALVNLAHIMRVEDPQGDAPRLWLAGAPEPIACSWRLSADIRRRFREA